jgi:nickel-dependent lactate racemase
MPSSLRYGPGTLLEIDIDPACLIADFSRLAAPSIQDPIAAVRAALAAPEGFPALGRATVPGDRVVVAIEDDVPQQAAVVAGIASSLVEANVLPEDVTILLSGNSTTAERDRIRQLLPERLAAELRIEQHDPHESKSLAYLAASKENKPIYFNRLLFDADMVLPVGCLRPGSSLGYLGVHGGLFPAFSDHATQQRFRTAGGSHQAVQQKRHSLEADEAAWLLGVHLMLQVVPGAGDSLLHVIAGEAAAVARRGRDLCEAAWLHRLTQSPQLVIAGIEGGSEVQTWENFSRALHAALAVTADHGAIVLCTDLHCRPGPALQHLAGEPDDDAARRVILHDRSYDALAALLLLEARARVEVFLLSGLAEETVEDLGVGYITEPEQIVRLSHQYRSCLLLGDAHRTMLELIDPQE